ncbi:MAG: dienelactone hydrolase family protein [Candidatus Melainabacteria bacterium]|nr:dienelactone hydrolase family protein [Candidatus Melainabacteria bacterium]
MDSTSAIQTHTIVIPAGHIHLEGNLTIPPQACGLVVFAHGSGSSRMSPRNLYVANALHKAGLATLLFDLLTTAEEAEDLSTGHLRFNIKLLAERLVYATDWLTREHHTRELRIGYFGASTGGAAALVAAAERPDKVCAVVSRGGRPDLADPALQRVHAPTLLIVGGNDTPVIAMNQQAFNNLHCVKKLEIVPNASHLFEEPGTLEQVSRLACDWFVLYLELPNQ